MKTEEGGYHELEEVEVEKDLGVEVDNKLKFSNHIQSKVNKANKVLGCLKYTFKNLNKEVFTLLYKALVRPHLEYASCVWSPSLKRDQDAIERIQRRATKLVPELRDLPYATRLQQLSYHDKPALHWWSMSLLSMSKQTDVTIISKHSHQRTHIQVENSDSNWLKETILLY